MIEALNDLVGIISKLPEYALWVLLGFLLYKLFVVGSIYGCIRLGINRLHDYLIKPKTITKRLDIGGYFLSEESEKKFLEFLSELKNSSLDRLPNNIRFKMTVDYYHSRTIYLAEIEHLRSALKFFNAHLRNQYEQKAEVPK